MQRCSCTLRAVHFIVPHCINHALIRKSIDGQFLQRKREKTRKLRREKSFEIALSRFALIHHRTTPKIFLPVSSHRTVQGSELHSYGHSMVGATISQGNEKFLLNTWHARAFVGSPPRPRFYFVSSLFFRMHTMSE